MVKLEQLATAALQGDGLLTRSLAQDFFREHPQFATVPQPVGVDMPTLAVSASLLELFALRRHQAVPTWTQTVGALAAPIFLLKAARTMKRLRALCEAEAPEPLRKRNLYAPPNYLEFA
jgi:hypothetical protein